MATHPSYSIVLTYAPERGMFVVQTVEARTIAPVLAGRLEVPIFVDEFDHKLDDEFARRLGVAMLNGIALGQPDIKAHMSVSQQPLPRPDDDT